MAERTPAQREILRRMVAAGAGARLRYRTEWLGWLPFGQYHGVDVERAGERPAALELPGGWELDDLLALERAGRLRRVGEARDPADDVHEIIYEIVEDG